MKKLWADRAWDDYLYWQTLVDMGASAERIQFPVFRIKESLPA